MNNEKNITRGVLSGKMGGYQPDPPQSVWEGVASGLRGRRFNRKLLIFLGAAAGLALAITVGITLFTDSVQPGMVTIGEPAPGQPSEAATEERLSAADKPEGRAGELREGEGQTSGESAFETGNTKPGNVSRLEQKVITAMQEVKEEQTAAGKKIAGRVASDHPYNEQAEPGLAETNHTETNHTETDHAEPGHAEPGQDVPDPADSILPGTDQPGTDEPGTGQPATDSQRPADGTGELRDGREVSGDNQQQQADNTNGGRVVNEDSLLRLLEGDAGEIAEQEIVAQKERKDRKWQLGATLSPLISYRDAASSDARQNVAVNNSESARLTYAGGVRFSYLPTDRLTIQTGVFYNKMGVNIGDYSSFKSGWFESEMDMVSTPARSESVVSISNSMGTVISGDEERFVNKYTGAGTLNDYHMLTPEEMIVADAAVESFSQTFEYLEIPFNVRYKILDRTIDLQLMGGISTNLLVNNSVAAIAGDETVAIGKVQDIRMFNYSGNAGFGVVYDLFDNFSFSIEPRFRYYLNSINTPNLPVTRPYTFGFYTGVNYKF